MPSDPDLYHEKYRIPSSRADWWEYYEGIYFITILVKNRRHAFGEIIRNTKTGNNQMLLSELGQFVDDEIPKIMNHYPYAYIPTWVVMPDHIHMIIMIDVRGRTWDYSNGDLSNETISDENGNEPASNDPGINDIGINDTGRDVSRHVSTIDINNTDISDISDNSKSSFMVSIAPKRGSLGLIIGRFKGAIKQYANTHHIPFAWQPRYHERIIKNQIGFDCVREYIDNNIANWGNKN